jgi:hypothetical protein
MEDRVSSPSAANQETASGKMGKWTAPVIVPLSCVVSTKHNPGAGLDGSVFPDSTAS